MLNSRSRPGGRRSFRHSLSSFGASWWTANDTPTPSSDHACVPEGHDARAGWAEDWGFCERIMIRRLRKVGSACTRFVYAQLINHFAPYSFYCKHMYLALIYPNATLFAITATRGHNQHTRRDRYHDRRELNLLTTN